MLTLLPAPGVGVEVGVAGVHCTSVILCFLGPDCRVPGYQRAKVAHKPCRVQQRSWQGRCCGHLAVFTFMTSNMSIPFLFRVHSQDICVISLIVHLVEVPGEENKWL